MEYCSLCKRPSLSESGAVSRGVPMAENSAQLNMLRSLATIVAVSETAQQSKKLTHA